MPKVKSLTKRTCPSRVLYAVTCAWDEPVVIWFKPNARSNKEVPALFATEALAQESVARRVQGRLDVERNYYDEGEWLEAERQLRVDFEEDYKIMKYEVFKELPPEPKRKKAKKARDRVVEDENW